MTDRNVPDARPAPAGNAIPALAAGFEPATRAQWQALVEKALKGADFEARLVSRTADGIAVDPVYVRQPSGPTVIVPPPGEAPFTRGSARHASAVGWRVASVHAERDPASLAASLAEDAAGGAHAAIIRIESAGQTGLPAERSAIEAALGVALDGPLSISLEPGSSGIDAALAFLDVVKSRGAQGKVARLGIDPLGTLARTGELQLMRRDGHGFSPSLASITAPGATLTADCRPYHEAGASEAQELAALAGTVIAYLRAAEAGGRGPDKALQGMALALSADADLFATIAKLRAARRIVWRVADACGAGAVAGRMQLVVTTSERMMARRDPWVNMLRVTSACAGAAFGGADEICVLPFTWALGRPDTFARRIARNVGIVLAEESGLGRVVDAAGGAWYVERLTDEIAEKAWSILQEWEAEGGMLAALTSGLVQDQIAAVATARADAIATGRQELTGSSAFPRLGEDGVKVEPWPTVPPLPSASVARPLPRVRLAAPFERLRDAAERAEPPPRVFLATLGTPAEHGARATWMTNFLAAGGIGVISGDGFTSSADAGRAFAESGAKVACIASSDAVYAELAEATAMALKSAGAMRVDLAGRPRKQDAALKAAGVDGFIFAGADAIELLSGLHRALGIAAGS